MNAIDVHTHIAPEYANLLVKLMDEVGLKQMVALAWHDGYSEQLKKIIDGFNKYPGRFAVFGNLNFNKINDDDFIETSIADLDYGKKIGMKGLKIYKEFGLSYAKKDGSLWKIDDRKFEPIWDKVGQLKLPLLIHTADPRMFWLPVNEHNFWYQYLKQPEFSWWVYYRKGLPSCDELIGERNEIIARHPEITFIAPHIGSNAEALEFAAYDLDAFPNLYYDISARITIMGLKGFHREAAREFIMMYADRILFGTDLICGYSLSSKGVETLDNAAQENFLKESINFYQLHFDFLATDREVVNPIPQTAKPYIMKGLKLPEEVCEKILFKNAIRIMELS